MKTLAMTLTFLAALPLAAQVTKEDLKKLTSAGISDEVIISYVKANGPVVKLSADDVIELKQAGASEKLLSVILGAPAPERQAAPPPATTTYLTQPTPYYYTPTSYYYDYYPTSYYPSYSYSYPRYYSSYSYPRYYSSYCYPSFSVGWSSGRWCSPRGSWGVSVYRR